MVDARVERVPADLAEATRRLNAAVKHIGSAERCADNESAYILLYAAVHKALSASLLSIGLRVGSGERGHAVLISEGKNHLPSEHVQLLNRLDRARRKRNDVAYETERITSAELEGMKRDAKKTLQAAHQFVQDQKPSPESD